MALDKAKLIASGVRKAANLKDTEGFIKINEGEHKDQAMYYGT
jgi:hypothetical protein